MQTLSKDLQPIYHYELSKGNQVLRVDEPAGTNCPLAIIFKFRLHFEEIANNLRFSPSIEKYENYDRHYPLEAGFFDKINRHIVAGPISGEYPSDPEPLYKP